MFSRVVPEHADRQRIRATPERHEIDEFLADTGVWISGGVIVALVLWLLFTELWH